MNMQMNENLFGSDDMFLDISNMQSMFEPAGSNSYPAPAATQTQQPTAYQATAFQPIAYQPAAYPPAQPPAAFPPPAYLPAQPAAFQPFDFQLDSFQDFMIPEPSYTAVNQPAMPDPYFNVPMGLTDQQPAMPEQYAAANQFVQQQQPAAAEEFEPEPAKPQSKLSKGMSTAFSLLFYVVCIAMVFGATMFAFSKDMNKSYLGYRLYSVKTPSMTPQPGMSGGFYKGDMIVVKLCKPEAVDIGDVITFVPDKEATSYLTHRVVDKMDELNDKPGIFFVTRGDANNANDNPITGDMVVGKKVFSIRFMGVVLQIVRENMVLSIVFILGVFGLITTIKYFFAESAKAKSKKKKEEPVVI